MSRMPSGPSRMCRSNPEGAILSDRISLQFTDPKLNGTPWYGDYKLVSIQANKLMPGSDIPPPTRTPSRGHLRELFDSISPDDQDSYDPNWSFFIGVHSCRSSRSLSISFPQT